MIAISKCLLGINCRYDGSNALSSHVIAYLKDKEYFMVCPEELGGLTTPRKPCEIIDGDGFSVIYDKAIVHTSDGIDVTREFVLGALKTYDILRDNKIDMIILKENSPSCGSAYVYDGTFSNNKISGFGITSAYLIDKGITIISDINLKGDDCEKYDING
jgi:uncharacterized protein YbbK (DUF523 family)